MEKLRILSFLSLGLMLFPRICGATTVFSQDFSSSASVSSYVNATTPGTNQFNAISTSGAAKAWSIASETLRFTSTGSNAAFASRTTDLATVPLAAMLSFDLNMISSSTALTSAFFFYLGTGFDSTNGAPANSAVHSRFALNFTNSSSFSVRDVSGTTNGSGSYGTGSRKVTFVTNNSGESISYLGPNGVSQSLGNDSWDLWVGTALELEERAATTASSSLSDMKFGSASSGTFSISIDNLTIAAIPEPGSALLGGIGILFLLRRRRI